jgi:hypothetical protein
LLCGARRDFFFSQPIYILHYYPTTTSLFIIILTLITIDYNKEEGEAYNNN